MDTINNENPDLTSLTDEELEALENEALAAFRELDKVSDDDITGEQLEELAALSESIQAVRGESSRRSKEREDRLAKRREVSQAIDPAEETEEVEEVEAVEELEPVASVETHEAAEITPKVDLGAIKRHAPAVKVEESTSQPEIPAVVITAAADIPGFANGQKIGARQIADAMHQRARGLADHSERFNVATINKPLAFDARSLQGEAARSLLQDAVDSVLKGKDAQALVASGGWCAPSETLYTMFGAESMEGLIDLPEVGVSRGGLNVPNYVGLSSVSAALWSWTEANDQAAAAPIAISDIDTTSGVSTATSTAHGLVTGQTVVISDGSVVGLDGTRTVTRTGADTFTFPSEAGDGTNATASFSLIKGCLAIPCPSFTDYRLEANGLCLTAGNLMDRAFPENIARIVNLTMVAHAHRMSASVVADIVGGATAVTVTTAPSDAAGDILNAIDLQVADYRSEHVLGTSTVLEGIFPHWFKEAIRATFAMRNGVEMTAVTDAQIINHFTVRNVRPQFLADYIPLYSSSPKQAWPGTSKFLLYPAGGYVQGSGGTLDLGVVRDSALNASNDFTAAWSEEFYTTIKLGPAAREVTCTTVVNGQTGGLEFAGA